MDEQMIELARKALLGVEMARTHLVQPMNGSHDYFYVSFAGSRIEFKLYCDDDHEAIRGPLGVEMAELSARASACATAINDLLFGLAKESARSAHSVMAGRVAELEEILSDAVVLLLNLGAETGAGTVIDEANIILRATTTTEGVRHG